MYSALKHDGKRLYELARAGKIVERPPRKVVITGLELLEQTPETLKLRAIVSKGTYIRTLVEDIAKALGTLAHVVYLRRTGVYPLTNPNMITMDEFEALGEKPEDKELVLVTIDDVLSHWKTVVVSDEQHAYIKDGRAVQTDEIEAIELCLVKTENQQLIALGEVDNSGELKVKRLLHL